MDLSRVFDSQTLYAGKTIYENQRVLILDEKDQFIQALVYDQFFFYVQIRFSNAFSTLSLQITKDGETYLDAQEYPYAAAVLYKLMIQGKYQLSCQLVKTKPRITYSFSDTLAPYYVTKSKVYQASLLHIITYVLKFQAYSNKDMNGYCNSIDDFFEYADSLHDSPKEELFVIQIFLHIFHYLSHHLDDNQEIQNLLLDECNIRINQILHNIPDPVTKTLYQMMLLNDHEIKPYLLLQNEMNFNH